MAENAQTILSKLGDERATILSAKKFIGAIVDACGGLEEMAMQIAELLSSAETPAGTKAAIYRAVINAILNINEAESVHGEVLDEQTNALIERLSTLSAEEREEVDDV